MDLEHIIWKILVLEHIIWKILQSRSISFGRYYILGAYHLEDIMDLEHIIWMILWTWNISFGRYYSLGAYLEDITVEEHIFWKI